MKYINGEKVLPKELLDKIQEYVQGGYLYIPNACEKKSGWGEKSGSRDYLKKRNQEIKDKYENGTKIKNLAEEFYLSIHSIKKIVYSK